MNNLVGTARRRFANLIDPGRGRQSPIPRKRAQAEIIEHRAQVGGGSPEMWYGIGKLQYHFLISRGLRHDHVFLDVACGALRLGQYLIPYLDKGHYFGLEAKQSLVDKAIPAEFHHSIIEGKEPRFSFNSTFDLSFIDRFDFAIAQSLFTHLTADNIALCFTSLREKAHADSVFYFTFFEGTRAPERNNWWYEFDELPPLALGWTLDYIGDWSHPRNQMMVKATPRSC